MLRTSPALHRSWESPLPLEKLPLDAFFDQYANLKYDLARGGGLKTRWPIQYQKPSL